MNLPEALKNAKFTQMPEQLVPTSHAGVPKMVGLDTHTGDRSLTGSWTSKLTACVLQPEQVPSIRVSTDG